MLLELAAQFSGQAFGAVTAQLWHTCIVWGLMKVIWPNWRHNKVVMSVAGLLSAEDKNVDRAIWERLPNRLMQGKFGGAFRHWIIAFCGNEGGRNATVPPGAGGCPRYAVQWDQSYGRLRRPRPGTGI